ncbi:LPS assembly lipoprotein LptE [Bartonella sp. CB178]|uniref:LPS assembly lipoprotein LptE n=1 Tax=Bartonella sp. CB178 TaxID=3112255 RepID=UPI00300DEECA
MSFFKNFALAGFAVFFLFLCGCTIEPLYRGVSQTSAKSSVGLSTKLASIIIDEPSDRFGQMVRNHLLFLLYGSGSKPSSPAYRLALQASVFTRNSVQIEFDRYREGRPSLGTVTGKASYTLQDMKNVTISQGMGTVSVSFERLDQEYATLQAEEDAQRRAAEEVAERILLSLSRNLSRR